MILARIDYLERRRKVRVDYLKFDYWEKRACAGMNSIENADVTMRMPSVLAEFAEEDFLVCGCFFFNFVVFPKTNIIFSFFLFCFVLEQL